MDDKELGWCPQPILCVFREPRGPNEDTSLFNHKAALFPLRWQDVNEIPINISFNLATWIPHATATRSPGSRLRNLSLSESRSHLLFLYLRQPLRSPRGQPTHLSHPHIPPRTYLFASRSPTYPGEIQFRSRSLGIPSRPTTSSCSHLPGCTASQQ